MPSKIKTIFNNRCFLHQSLISFISIIAGHFVVMNNAAKTWLVLLHTTYYYYSVLASAVIAFCLINYVYWVTKRLDKEDGAVQITKTRAIKQLYKGLGGGMVLEIILAGILFSLFGQNIFNNGFFDKLFAAIVLFLMLVNVCYCFYFFYVRQKDMANQVVIVETIKTAVRYKIIEPKAAEVIAPKEMPYLIYLVRKVPMAYGGDGNMMPWESNITASLEILPMDDYFQISKQIIINRAIIKGLKNYRAHHVFITPVFPVPIKLISSRRRSKPFKVWLASKGMEVETQNDGETA